MKAIIDTSSLLAIIRYYLPFDDTGKFKEFLKEKFESGEICIIDKVVIESKMVAKGSILKSLDFIEKSKKIIKTTDILPSDRFYNLLENHFRDNDLIRLKKIDEIEYEVEKTKYLNDADANLIIYAMSIDVEKTYNCYRRNKKQK